MSFMLATMLLVVSAISVVIADIQSEPSVTILNNRTATIFDWYFRDEDAAGVKIPGEIERGFAAEHHVDDGRVGPSVRSGLQFAETADDDDVMRAVIAAKLLDIHGDEEFILQNKDSHSVEQIRHPQLLP